MKSPYQRPMVANLSSKPRSPWILKPTPIAYFYEFLCRALFFNILDYTGSATRLFADPDFDGEPALITEEEMNESGDTVKEEIEKPEEVISETLLPEGPPVTETRPEE